MKKIIPTLSIAVMLATVSVSEAATFYWVGDSSPAFYAESNWSTVANNAASEPGGDPLAPGVNITDDLVIAGLYNGAPTSNAIGGTPVDDMTGGVSGSGNPTFSGNTVAVSGTTIRIGDNYVLTGDASDQPVFGLSGGAIVSAEAMRETVFNLADTSQLIFWGTGAAVFTNSTFNFQSTDASIRLKNVAFGVDISSQLAGAAGYEFNGSSITVDDLLITNDGSGGTLIQAIPAPAIPAPAALPAGLAMLGVAAARRRRR